MTRPSGASPRVRLALGTAWLLGALLACGPSRGTIGAVLAQSSEKRLFVREVPAGLAADRAGVRPGDEVLLIDGRDARQMSSEGVHSALAGNVGDPVKLTLIRDGNVVRLRLERTPAARPSAPAQVPPP